MLSDQSIIVQQQPLTPTSWGELQLSTKGDRPPLLISVPTSHSLSLTSDFGKQPKLPATFYGSELCVVGAIFSSS